MIVTKYVLHLYCDHREHVGWRHGHQPDEYTGETEREAMHEAKEAGWIITGRRVLCPIHAPRER